MAKNNNLTDFVTDIANHIRGKVGLPSTSKINPQNFSDYVDAMPHLVDISEQFPDLVANVVKGGAKTIALPDNFPWKTLSDGSNFISVVVLHGVLSYKFSEVVADTGLGAMVISTPSGNEVASLNIDGGDTNSHTVSCWWGIPAPSYGSAYDVNVYYNQDDPNSAKFDASIVVTPYIVKIGDRVLSLQTCKGEA